jgi:hypothetical protein
LACRIRITHSLLFIVSHPVKQIQHGMASLWNRDVVLYLWIGRWNQKSQSYQGFSTNWISRRSYSSESRIFTWFYTVRIPIRLHSILSFVFVRMFVHLCLFFLLLFFLLIHFNFLDRSSETLKDQLEKEMFLYFWNPKEKLEDYVK